jgi:hypothetical protein
MPIWVYEDGRVISARSTTPNDWTGFLEQRLTPEGVELVRAEIVASRPNQDYCLPGGPGGGAYSDGSGRTVCEHARLPGARFPQWGELYPRLWELPHGARSWLPASAWEDPEPKPYVPSRYVVWITREGPGAEAIDRSAVVADASPEAADLLAGAMQCNVEFFSVRPDADVCWTLKTEDARLLAAALGENEAADGAVSRWGYSFFFVPVLPHAPVFCCAG